MVLNFWLGDFADDMGTTKYIENIQLVNNGYFIDDRPLS